MPFQSRSFQGKYGGGGRSADDYGILGLSDEVLQELASNPNRYGEKSGLAAKELAQRRGLMGQANQYRAALEKAAYGDFGRQYGAGLGQITNYLARSGPLADSGAGTALRAKLASQLYGQAQSRIGSGYADYLGNLFQGRNAYNYQRSLLEYQKRLNKRSPLEQVGGFLAGAGGAFIPG